MNNFTGRTVLVTGAAGGIGGATVRHLVAAGADVIASDHPAADLTPIADATGARTLPFDLESEESVRAAITGLDLFGVVNCAGWGGVVTPLTESDLDVFDQVVRINTRGVLLVTKYAAKEMIRIGHGGAIVNVSSQAGLVALTGHASYAASKSGVDSITRVAALELGAHSIRVNSVNPTVVMTPMSASYWGLPEIEGPFLDAMPLHRWATEDDIAAPITFLLGDGASMITGVSLPVDGGYSIR